MTYPRCRAGWTRSVLQAARELPAARSLRVLDTVGAEMVGLIDAKSFVAWLPFDVHMTLLRACRTVLGPRLYRELFRSIAWSALENPLLFAKQASFGLQLWDCSIWASMRVMPVAFRYIFDGAGELGLEISADDQQATVTYAGLPSGFAGGDVWSLSWLGALDAIVEHALARNQREADVQLLKHDPNEGFYVWAARARRRSIAEAR